MVDTGILLASALANPGASILFVISQQILPRAFQCLLNSPKGRHQNI